MEKTATGPCIRCGLRDYSINYTEPIRSQLVEMGVCFSCHYWISMLGRFSNNGADSKGMVQVIAEGKHYCFDGNKPMVDLSKPGFYGYGGREWTIEFFSGQVVKTNNLWSQNSIPDHFLQYFPDNAKLIEHIRSYLPLKYS